MSGQPALGRRIYTVDSEAGCSRSLGEPPAGPGDAQCGAGCTTYELPASLHPGLAVERCPYCSGPVDPQAASAGTCGAFGCLYRHFDGGLPPVATSALALPWSDPAEVARIAVFRPGQLGDLLLAMPGLRALRSAFPSAEITLVAGSWTLDFPLRFGCIDRVLPMDLPLGRPDDAQPNAESDRLLAGARAHRYDLVLQLQGDSVPAARFALAMSARATAGFCRDEKTGRHFHLLLPSRRDEPEVLRVMRLVDALGGKPQGVDLQFPPLPGESEELEAIPGVPETLEGRPVVVIHPGARAPARRWPLERFAELARRLRRGRGANLVMVGGSEEVPLAEEAIQMSGVPALNLAGRLSLGALAALLGRADIFVGNDSGPAQLASAVAPRSLRVFGPANLHRWAPLNRLHHRIVYRKVECSPCGHWECPIDHRCLRWVSIEEVLAEAEALLDDAS